MYYMPTDIKHWRHFNVQRLLAAPKNMKNPLIMGHLYHQQRISHNKNKAMSTRSKSKDEK